LSKKEFDEFIKSQASKASTAGEIDWNVQLSEWKNYLSEFYNRVEGYLSEYIEDGNIALQYTTKRMHEEYIGNYEVNRLHIKLANKSTTLEPIGTNLIGSKGRVNLEGSKASIRFALIDKNADRPRVSVRTVTNQSGNGK